MMKRRYLFEIPDGPSPYYGFAYFDTEEHLADSLFAREHVDVTILGELEEEDVEEPFRFVLCRVPREQRSGFLRAIDDLPDLMSAMGKTGYDEFCQTVMLHAPQFMRSIMKDNNIPLQ